MLASGHNRSGTNCERNAASAPKQHVKGASSGVCEGEEAGEEAGSGLLTWPQYTAADEHVLKLRTTPGGSNDDAAFCAKCEPGTINSRTLLARPSQGNTSNR